MILCDVNVLLYAMMASTEHHVRCRSELEKLRRGSARMAVSELVLAAVVRIATNQKAFRPPASPKDAFAFVEALVQPRVVRIAPGERHWRLYRDLVLVTGIRGADTTDAYLAALAIEHGCEWWTTDRGFERFPGLRWRNLLA